MKGRSLPALRLECSAPAQFERRMMSQLDFTAPFSDCCDAWRLPLPVEFFFVPGGRFQARREFFLSHAENSASAISPAASASVRTAASASVA